MKPDGPRKAVFALFALIGLLTCGAILAGFLAYFIAPMMISGKVLQQEDVMVILAGKPPREVTVLPCGGREQSGKVVGNVATATFDSCEGPSYVILPFADFDAVCTIPYTSGTIANREPWRFRIVGHKCLEAGA